MKPSIVADEMFPEGAGPYMDIEEVSINGEMKWTYMCETLWSVFFKAEQQP